MIATKKTKQWKQSRHNWTFVVSILLTVVHGSHITGVPCGNITIEFGRSIKHCKSVVQLFVVQEKWKIERKNFQMLINATKKTKQWIQSRHNWTFVVSILLTLTHVSNSTGLPCGEITVKTSCIFKHCKSVVQLCVVQEKWKIEERISKC